MQTELLIILLILIMYYFFFYISDDEIIKYNDLRYFEKFKNKTISKLIGNNEIKKPINKINKILIITYDNRNNLPYVNIHNQNLELYSKKWNFEYKFYDKCSYNNYWCKIYLVLEAINTNKYDFVMWMDSDTFIFNTNINLSSILNKYLSDIFIALDNNPYYDITNAGVFIIKNSNVGKQFLMDCIYGFNPICRNKNNCDLKGKWAASCYEQGIMNLMIADKYQNNTTILTNDLIFNYNKCNNNVFIMHLYASTNQYRVNCFNSKK